MSNGKGMRSMTCPLLLFALVSLVQLFAKECGVDTTLAATEAAPIVTDNEKRQTIGDELGDRGAVEGDKDDDEDEDEEEEDEEDDSEGIETLLVDKVLNPTQQRGKRVPIGHLCDAHILRSTAFFPREVIWRCSGRKPRLSGEIAWIKYENIYIPRRPSHSSFQSIMIYTWSCVIRGKWLFFSCGREA